MEQTFASHKEEKGKTLEIVGKKVGVGRETLRKAKKRKEKAKKDPEIAEKLGIAQKLFLCV